MVRDRAIEMFEQLAELFGDDVEGTLYPDSPVIRAFYPLTDNRGVVLQVDERFSSEDVAIVRATLVHPILWCSSLNENPNPRDRLTRLQIASLPGFDPEATVEGYDPATLRTMILAGLEEHHHQRFTP